MVRASFYLSAYALWQTLSVFLSYLGFASTPPAIAGYPIINVPLGFQPDSVTPTAAEPTVKLAPGMPFGISFIGTAWSEYKLIGYAYAYEQATQNRLKRLAYEAAIPKTQLVDIIGK
ncbi:hypothetical protein JAAARDRAFT_194653 [Jaapia argillacea MUCL 33604]|uniref:Uncharacterized protein n=1 Tax=Jaapia argillacea MUCL 33604 TaxID=933084 RepID=A0A067PS69_9AGAM|nr:hypothetical protein JAAARDRAFT_194653 [Jaapia argillacea MUCL 33604]